MSKHYFELSELKDEAPDLFGIPTGTKLDEMFFKIEKDNGKYVKKPLGGIPYLSVMNLTGIPDSGKSRKTAPQRLRERKPAFLVKNSAGNNTQNISATMCALPDQRGP